jgi:tripartite-type tricarboxylate transporter receptor subunit TctC
MPLTGDSQVNEKAFRIAINSRKLARFYPHDREKSGKKLARNLALCPIAARLPRLVAGQIDLLLAPRDQLPLVRAGKLKALAVTSDMRLALAPDIPTFAEMGLPALSSSGWYAFFAPKGTAKDIVGRLNSAAVEALADPAVRSRITELGAEIFPRERQTPEALGALQKADAEKWWPVIKELGTEAQ